MLRKPNNVFSVILDDRTNAASALPNVGTVVTDANLAEGAICMVDVGMRRIAASTPSGGGYDVVDRYRIVQGKGAGNPLMISPVITKANATISTSVHKPAAQQITAVGFNGTTGSLPTALDTDFFIKIRKNDNDAANRSQPMSLFAGPVKTDPTSTTQADLAFALVANGIVNFAKEPANNYLTFSALSDEAGAAVTGTLVNLVFTKGSREVVSDTLNVTITNVAVGDAIKVAAATTSSVYKVTAVENGTATTPAKITLSYAFQEETATVAKATARRITEAALNASECGVRMTGVAADFDVNAFRDYYANRFTVTFSDPTTLVTHLQGAFNGNGVWQQVAMDEYMSYGYEGQNDMLATPPRLRDQEVIVGDKYGCMIISSEESIDGLVSLSKGKAQVVVYLNLDANGAFPGTLSTGEDLATNIFPFSDSDFEEI